MSSIITVWGTFKLPRGARQSFREALLDGGAEAGAGPGEYAGYFAEEHEAVAVAEAMDRADEVHHFLRFEEAGDALHVRAGLGDDDWSEWLAILGGMARAAARLGATGWLELDDDERFMGRLALGGGQTRWVEGEAPEDEAGRDAVGRIFAEMVGQAGARTARKTAARKAPARKAPARKASTTKKMAGAKKARSR